MFQTRAPRLRFNDLFGVTPTGKKLDMHWASCHSCLSWAVQLKTRCRLRIFFFSPKSGSTLGLIFGEQISAFLDPFTIRHQCILMNVFSCIDLCVQIFAPMQIHFALLFPWLTVRREIEHSLFQQLKSGMNFPPILNLLKQWMCLRRFLKPTSFLIDFVFCFYCCLFV